MIVHFNNKPVIIFIDLKNYPIIPYGSCCIIIPCYFVWFFPALRQDIMIPSLQCLFAIGMPVIKGS